MDRGAWWATVHGVTKSGDRTERLTLSLFTKPQVGMDETVRADTKNFRINHRKNGLARFFFFSIPPNC